MSSIKNTKQIIRRPTQEDIDFVVENIRDIDELEVVSFDGETVRSVLESTEHIDKNAWVWEKDGEVQAIFGVNPIEGYKGAGIIWLLATKTFDKYFKSFIAACRVVFEQVIRDYEYLFNYVHVENKKSIKWLEWLGFDVKSPTPIGINGAKFHRFEMWNEKCVTR